MKHNFMNKENGKVASVLVMYLDDDGHMQTDSYDKVEDLLEDYAAYEPAKPEPLIKDEKIRKAVRAWAEANNIRAAYYSPDEEGFYVKNFDGEVVAGIYFGDEPMDDYNYDWSYTIAELCGEERE